jgi:hypothetical protein
MSEAEDPGWPGVVSVFLMSVPFVGLWYMRRHRSGDPLVLLRALFLNFSNALIAFGIVIAFIPDLRNGPVTPSVPLLLASAVASIVGVHLAMRKPLACSSEAALAASYRARFFRTIAITEAVALFGFVLTFDFGPAWTYYAGGAFALFRFWTITAPTRSALRRDQDALNAQGCDLSLTSALRGTLPPTNKWGLRPT